MPGKLETTEKNTRCLDVPRKNLSACRFLNKVQISIHLGNLYTTAIFSVTF